MEYKSEKKWLVPFAAALFAMLCLQMSNLGFSPLLPSIQKEFDLNYSQIGLFTGMYGIIAIFLSLPTGISIKKWGEKTVLLAGTSIVIIGLLLLSQSTDFNSALTNRAIWIAGYRFSFISILTAVSLTAPSHLKGRVMGIVGAVSSLASVIGAPLAGSLAESFGWRYGFAGYIATDILSLIAIYFFYTRQSQGEVGSLHQVGEKTEKSTVNAFKVPYVWGLGLVISMAGMSSLTITYFVPSAGDAIFGMTKTQTAWIISMGYLLAIPVNLLAGYFSDKYSKWWTVITLTTIGIIGLYFLSSRDEVVFKGAAIVVLAFSFACTNQNYSIAGELLKGRETGNVMGVISLLTGISAYMGPQLLGVLRDRTGNFDAGWYMIMTIVSIALGGIFILKKFVKA
ncbi:MAG: MFS transporter [Saprospiraceae bacterium]|nr:MFS transporter [Saprospiraceae bacterium]